MKFILDYSKWRCGYNGPNKVGDGVTQLLNKEGFMCCLGQFEQQRGVSEEVLLGNGEPQEIYSDLDGDIGEDDPFVKKCKYDDCYIDSDLATDLIEINDEIETTAHEKALAIKSKLELEGHELEMINFPI